MDTFIWWLGLIAMIGIVLPGLLLVSVCVWQWVLDYILTVIKINGAVFSFMKENWDKHWWGGLRDREQEDDDGR